MALTLVTSNSTNSLAQLARKNRREALMGRAKCIVTITHDGNRLSEHAFDGVPTLETLIGQLGPNAFIAGVRMERISARTTPFKAYATAAE